MGFWNLCSFDADLVQTLHARQYLSHLGPCQSATQSWFQRGIEVSNRAVYLVLKLDFGNAVKSLFWSFIGEIHYDWKIQKTEIIFTVDDVDGFHVPVRQHQLVITLKQERECTYTFLHVSGKESRPSEVTRLFSVEAESSLVVRESSL